MRREVLEEAGVEFEPEAVIALEHNSQGYWIRITFAGNENSFSLEQGQRGESGKFIQSLE